MTSSNNKVSSVTLFFDEYSTKFLRLPASKSSAVSQKLPNQASDSYSG